MKKLLIFIFLFSATTSFAFLNFFKDKEVNPDYTQTYWDKLMKRQSAFDISRGLGQLQMMRYEDAVNTFAKAVIKNPKEPYAHIFFGMALYWTGKVDAAMGEYKQAIELDQDNEEAYQLLGIAYGWKGDTAKAKENFLTADKLNNKRPDVKMNLSSVYAAEDNLDTAIDYARAAVNISPRSPLYHFHLGTLFEAIGRDSQAAESFNKALRLFPRYEDAMLALGAMYEKRGENKDALSFYRRAVNTKPGDFVARLRYANLLFTTGQSKDAKDIVEESFKITPSNKGGLALDVAYNSSGLSAASENKSQEAENIKKMLSQYPPSKDLQVEMQITYSPAAPKLAVQKEQSALEREVNKTEAQKQTQVFRRLFVFNAGSAEERGQQIDNMAGGIDELVNSVPQGQELKFSMKASTPQRAAPSAPSDSDANSGYNPRSVGNDMGLWVTGRSWVKFVEEVVPDIEDRLDADNANSFDYILRGLAYLTLGNGDAAYDSFDKAGKTELSLLGKGTAMIVQGKENAARDFYEQVLAINPKNSTALSNIKVLNTEKK